jgi:hypothetical protein
MTAAPLLVLVLLAVACSPREEAASPAPSPTADASVPAPDALARDGQPEPDGVAAPEAAPADPCGQPIHDQKPAVCSMPGTESALLTITNGCTTRALEVFWVNHQCTELSYGKLAPGQRFESKSSLGHYWRLRDATSQVLLREIGPVTGPLDAVYP